VSGNGHHVQYLVDLPNNEETKTLLTGLYRGLDIRISTADVRFDPTVRNPSRIFRMYGTTNRKCGRRSGVVMLGEYHPVRSELVVQAAQELTPPKPKPKPKPAAKKNSTAKGLKNFDVVGLFQSMGLYKRPLADGKHAVICIQAESHSDPDQFHKTDTVIWEGEWPQFHCSHAHCEGLNIHDVINQFA